VLADDLSDLPRFDDAVFNGVFTEKVDLSYDEMLDFFERTVTAVFGLVAHGVARSIADGPLRLLQAVLRAR
jgi:hypothetical protein